ncbi:O-antigen ligase family protein [Ramlibacter ginsenosidimutans]|nr:O-antigen ligase family protein [Ramlibacter ginsenosidimutans]
MPLGSRRTSGPGGVLYPLACFAFFGLASVLWSIDPSISLERAFLNIAAVGVLWVFSKCASAEDQLRVILAFSAACIIVVILASLPAYVGQPASAYFQGNFRGYFSNSNSLAHYAAFATPLCCAGLLQRSRRIRGVALLTLVYLVYVLLDSRSRAAFAAVLLSSLIVFFGSRRRVITPMNLLILAPGIAFALYVFVQFATNKYEGVDTVGTRLYLWQIHLDAITQRPQLGWGIGINPVDFKLYTAPGYNYLADTEKGSSYISLPEELGLWFAIPFFLILLPQLAQRLYAAYVHGHKYANAAMRLVPAGLVLGSLVHASFESWLFSFGNPLAFSFWMSCIYLASHATPSRPNLRRASPSKRKELIRAVDVG